MPLAHPLTRMHVNIMTLTPLLLALAPVQDWPQWRGPDRTNIARESDWSSVGAAKPLWRADVGTGYSTPIVAAGRVYTVGYRASEDDPNSGEDEVRAFDAKTGEEAWSLRYPSVAFANEHRGGVIGTPGFADGVLYVATRDGHLRALDAATGEVRWHANLTERHSLQTGRYGFASSPYVDGDRLVICMGSVLSLETKTGETQWISENIDASYSTVAALTLPGEVRAFAAFGGRGLFAIDAASGETLRHYEFRTTPRNVEGATPIVLGTEVFVSSGYDQGAAFVDLAPDPPTEKWRSRRMRTKLAGTTFTGGHFYGHDESMLACLSKDGDLVWRERGLGQGAMSIAGDRMLLTTSEGELVVAAVSPGGFTELSRTKVIDDGVFWATPVIAGGLVYVRGSFGDLVCLDHRRGAAGEVAGAAAPEGVEAPTAAELEARYLQAVGAADLAKRGLAMSGTLHVVALGIEGSSADWSIDGDGRWTVRYDLPPAIRGEITETFDGERGWKVDPYRGNAWLEEETVHDLRASGGHSSLLDPVPDSALESKATLAEFRGLTCWRVDVAVTDEETRAVYFDAKTGLYAGRTAPSESTVVLGDWREVDGTRVPFRRTEFEVRAGLERRWAFESAKLERPDDEVFEVPEGLE